mgnify:CR=1 FL=1
MGRWAATFRDGVVAGGRAYAQQRQNTGSGRRRSGSVPGPSQLLRDRWGRQRTSAFQAGQDGVVVVDAGIGSQGRPLSSLRSRNQSPQPIRYVIDTSADPDHVGGNERIAKASGTLFTAPTTRSARARLYNGAAAILSAEKVLTRMSAPDRAAVPVSHGPRGQPRRSRSAANTCT